MNGPSAETLAVLESNSWPGNVRELENLVQRALIDFGTLADSDGIRSLIAVKSQGVDSAPKVPSIGDNLTIEQLEDCCYADCDGNGVLDFFDFLCFQNEFAVGCP